MLQSGHGRRDRRTDGRTDGRSETNIPPTTSLFGGYNKCIGFPQISWPAARLSKPGNKYQSPVLSSIWPAPWSISRWFQTNHGVYEYVRSNRNFCLLRRHDYTVKRAHSVTVLDIISLDSICACDYRCGSVLFVFATRWHMCTCSNLMYAKTIKTPVQPLAFNVSGLTFHNIFWPLSRFISIR